MEFENFPKKLIVNRALKNIIPINCKQLWLEIHVLHK